jgi:hypothetical protein
MNSMAEDGLMQIAPADVSALFTPIDLSTPTISSPPCRRGSSTPNSSPSASPLRDFLKSRSPIEETGHPQGHPAHHVHARISTHLEPQPPHPMNNPLFTTRRDFLRTTLLGGALTWTVPSFVAQTFSASTPRPTARSPRSPPARTARSSC